MTADRRSVTVPVRGTVGLGRGDAAGRRRVMLAAAVAAVGLAGAATAARADTFYDQNPSTSTAAVPVGTGNDFTNAANWQNASGGSAVPGGGDTAVIDNGGVVLIQAGDTLTTGDVVTGSQNVGYGTVVMTGGSLTFNNGTYLRLARSNTLESNTSLFQISSGTVSGAGQIRVGEEGYAVFNMSGGTVSSTGDIYVANANNASSTPMGTVNLTGGTLNDGGYLNIGRVLNANTVNVVATLNLSAGATLNVPNRPISMQANTGVLNVTGGTLAGGSDLYVAEGRGGVNETDTFNMGGGTVSVASLGVAPNAAVGGSSTATVNLTGGTLTVTRVYQGTDPSDTGTFNFNGGTLQANASVGTYAGTFMTGLTAANVLAGGARIDSNGQNITVGQNLSNGTGGGADGGLTKLGAGVLTLTGTNAYTGPTNISAGAIDVSRTASLPSSAAATTVANGAGLVLGIGGPGQYTTATSFASVATFAGPTASVGFDTSSGNASYGSNITGASVGGTVTSLGFIKGGANTLVLTGTNTYTGPTLVAGGVLQAGGPQALGSNSAFNVGAGAKLDLNGFNATAGSLAGSGTLSLGAATLTVGTDNTSTTFSGNINNGSGGSLVKVGTGTLTLANYDNNFTGGTTVNGGTLNLNNNYNPYYGTVSGPITINSGGTVKASLADTIGYGGGVGTSVTQINVNAGGTFDIANSGNEGYRTNVVLTGGTLSATGGGLFNFTNGYGITSNASGTTANFSAGIDIRDGATLPVAVAAGTTASGSDLTISGPIVDSLYGGGASALAKTGAGTLTLSGADTYKGGTNVSAGSLVARSNSAVGTGPVTVGAGAVLAVRSGGSNGSGGRTVLYVNGLTLAGSAGAYTSKVDVGANDLDLPGASLAVVTAMAAQGFAGGTWNGSGGIVSAAAAANAGHLIGVGVIQNNGSTGTPLYGDGTSAPLFDKAVVGASDILVKETYYGDTNLDGVVNAADYTRIDAGFVNHLTGWQNGDFNYDGTVDGTDYALMDNAFNQQSVALAAAVVAASPALAVSTVAVPEPATAAAAVLMATALAGRRRRRR